MTLKKILLAQIAESGPMPFERFQRAALYHPEHGFFSKGELRSTKAGDFLTSPEVSPLFGEALSVFVERERQRIVPPEGGRYRSGEAAGVGGSFHMIEVGAGSGSLLKPLLDSLTFEPEVWAIEASPTAREALADRLPPYPRPFGAAVPSPQGGDYSREALAGLLPPYPRPSGAAVLSPQGGDYSREALADLLSPSPPARHSPRDAVGGETEAGSASLHILSSIEDLPDHLTGVILANELLDNLPVAIATLTETGWRERWVGADGDQLTLVDAPARPEVVEWCDRFAGPCPIDGYVEVQLEAARWLETALGKLDRGALVLIDYGDTAENLEPRRTEGTLRTYRAHHLGPHPLDEPGETDITVDVNFTALEAIARELDARVEYHRQDDFLASLGLRERLSQLRREELALARDGDPMERLKVRSVKSEVETLLHPRGLGDFRVLIARVG